MKLKEKKNQLEVIKYFFQLMKEAVSTRYFSFSCLTIVLERFLGFVLAAYLILFEKNVFS